MTQRCLYILLAAIMPFIAAAQQRQQYVAVKNGQFVVNNKPWYFIGTNYWYGGLLAQGKDAEKGKARLRKELDFLKAQGVTNLRVLAGSEGHGLVNGVERVKPVLQPEHGVYNKEWMEGLDYLLYEMGKRQMYAVLFLSNNWEWSGGFLQYLNWNGQLTDSAMKSKMNWGDLRDNTSRFYHCTPCQEDYRKQVEYIITHVNRYTKRSYRNEPAIMAWELANEPRPMRPAAVDAYKQWTAATAAYIKTLDSNHLITLGTEGIMGTEESADLFREVHTPAQVDYLTLHIWPKNWSWFKDTAIAASLPVVKEKAVSYIQTHAAIAQQLKKPLVVEEFGLPRNGHAFEPSAAVTLRNELFASIFGVWKQSRTQGGPVAGCNFWAFGGTARPIEGQTFWKEGNDFMGDPPQEEQGLNTVFDSDVSTWKLIRSFIHSK